MKTKILTIIVLLIFALLVSNAHAVFIVETADDGRGYANFSSNGTPNYSTFTISEAIGCIGTSSAYGGDADPDIYTFSYTPGTDSDNFSIAAGTDLGNGVLASGLTGGVSGYYNVYVSWPWSDNVSGGPTIITATNDSDDVIISVDEDADSPTATPGADEWVLVAQGVQLTQGVTYTVSMTPTYDGGLFCPIRAQGAMWEAVPPLPTNPDPNNFDLDVPIDKTLSWDPVPNATISYQGVVISEDKTLADANDIVASGNSLDVYLKNSRRYYWRVDTEGTEGGSPFSREGTVWTFETAPCVDGPGFTDGDVNEDCQVNVKDLAIIAKNWLLSGS
jgi:hypothetical protein